MESVTDTCYIKRIQAGETDCFAFLLERYSRSVHSLIVKIVGNREDAEELTQDVFLKVYRSLASFQGNSSFSTWLYRIAYNTAVSATRKKKREWLAIEDGEMENVAEEDVSESLEQISGEEQLARLEQALEQLLPDERALILLFYMQEKTVEEIVSITGLTTSNVKTRLHRIRKKLFVLMKTMEENKDEKDRYEYESNRI
ncbi:MAG: RNA polymerase sigma factor [Tannerella sp.]|jgi:RNA polymerase sigma-70 factor (ECF subfamily)|nr:RNA polymerase sigma factor [Tannerella sp.]